MNNKINEDLKSAMKEKDTFKLSVLRMLKSALQMEQIAKKHELSDTEVASVIKKQVKVRKDSVEEYKKYGKDDSVKDLEQEIAILENYLPEEMSQAEIEAVINSVFETVKPTSMKDMGLVMKNVNELLADKNADMSLVSKLVKEKLSNM
ncbi:MAG TPA: GatB/YqeY domain-containing protein [Candidatus Onthocola stercoravium]|nr:GatB/YqeY domain-containing protein [Candidatus Onthocola stercoravium]